MNMRLTELLFSFKGRIGRQYWWLTSIAAAAIAGMANSLIELAAKVTANGTIDPETNEFDPSAPFLAGILVISLVNTWITYALSTKRLHDLNQSGWWLVMQAALLLAAVATAFAAGARPEGEQKPLLVAAAVVGVIAIAVSIGLFVELGFFKGTQGPNSYGPDPLSSGQADAKL